MRVPDRLSAVFSLLSAVASGAIVAGCEDTPRAAPPQMATSAPPPMPRQTVYYPPGYPAQPTYGAPPAPPVASAPPAYAPPGYPAPPVYLPAPAPTPVATAPLPQFPSSARPQLGPLVGSAAWQAEVRAVVRELISNLSPQNAFRVSTIPLVFDPNPNEINAFAGCDDNGAPFVAGTEGLLEAVDAIAQTKSTDELFGTQTYGAYVRAVAPRLVSQEGGSAMLGGGLIAASYWSDPRRISRAHEMFDEIVAFTFGHELSHHYLGHTGCANGQGAGAGPAIAELGQLATAILPGLNQPNEILADTNGCINTLDSGRARASWAFPWSEEGGLWLLDFFARLETAAGSSPLLGFLRTHPNPGLRIPVVETVAATWRFRNPR